MEKSWWKQVPDSAVPTTQPLAPEKRNDAEQIFYMAAEDGGSVMTGMSQQELLRKKARSESKKRNKLFGSNKKKRKKNPIVSLPPGLLPNGKKESSNDKFYSSSSMPSDHGSTNNRQRQPRHQPATTAQGRPTTRTIQESPGETPKKSSSGNELWKAQWGLDGKKSATRSDSTFTDNVPTIQKTPSMEMPFSTVPETWAVMNETEDNLFLHPSDSHLSAEQQQRRRSQNQRKDDDNCSIDEYSFPLLSTGALGGILEDVVQQRQQREAMFETERGLESIPELNERHRAISMSRSDGSGRVRFSATAELSTIISSDEGVARSEMDESTDVDVRNSTSFLSYQIDLDSPISVAEILCKSANYTPTPTKRRRKPTSAQSPVQSILRPAKYGDRNGKEIGGLQNAYIRAMSYWKASQILQKRRSPIDEQDDFQRLEEYASKDLTWIPAVTEDNEQLRFVDPSGAELSPIREAKPSSISEANSKSEDWSENEDSETMQRLHFIEAVAAVVIQTAYRRYRGLKLVDALRYQVAHARLQQKKYADEMRRSETEQKKRSTGGSSSFSLESERSKESGNQEDLHHRTLDTPRSPGKSWDGRVPQPVSPQPHSPQKRDQSKAANAEAGSRSLKRSMWNESISESNGQSSRGALHFQSLKTDESLNHPVDSTARNEEIGMMRKQALLDEFAWEEDGEVNSQGIKPKQLQEDFQDNVCEPRPISSAQQQTFNHDNSIAPLGKRRSDGVNRPMQGQIQIDEDIEEPTMEREASREGEGIPYQVQRRINSYDNPLPAVSSKPSFSESVAVSEITMDVYSTCIEEPRRKSVSEYIHKMEGEVNRKSPPEEVVNIGQPVKIIASVGGEGNRSKSAPNKRTDGTEQGRNGWRKDWIQSSRTEPAKTVPVDEATGLSGSSLGDNTNEQDNSGDLDGSFESTVKQRSLPSPYRKPSKKDISSVSSYGDTESSYPGHLLIHGQAVSGNDTSEDLFAQAAVKIQCIFRGFWVRDCINVDHYCAMVIQKAFRGYLCRVNFQYDRYRIVLVQSIWRRSIARSDVAHVLACAILIQAVARGFLHRKKCAISLNFDCERDQSAALVIQCSWRKFWCESVLIRTLVDVLISQSVARGWLARQKLKRLKALNHAQRSSLSNINENQSNQVTESTTGEKQSSRPDYFDNAPDDEKSSDAGGSQRGMSQGSLAGSMTSSDSSLPDTPPKNSQRITLTRSACARPLAPSLGENGMSDARDESPILLTSLDNEEESEPGFIPAVRRAPYGREGISRDGRPPISPGPVKSSKLAERYESGLRQAEKDRNSIKTSSRGSKSQKVQIIPPVDIEDVSSPIGSTANSEESFEDASKDCDTSIVATESSRADSENTEEAEAQRGAEIAKLSKNNRVMQSIHYVENLPEDNPFKGYYKLWAELGLFCPRSTPEATSAIRSSEGSHSGVDPDGVRNIGSSSIENPTLVGGPSSMTDETNSPSVMDPSSMLDETNSAKVEEPSSMLDEMNPEEVEEASSIPKEIQKSQADIDLFDTNVGSIHTSHQIDSLTIAGRNDLHQTVQDDTKTVNPFEQPAPNDPGLMNFEEDTSHSAPLVQIAPPSFVPETALADSASATCNDDDSDLISLPGKTSLSRIPQISLPDSESLKEKDDQLTVVSHGRGASLSGLSTVSGPESKSVNYDGDEAHNRSLVDSAPSEGVSKLLQALSGLTPTKSLDRKVSSAFVPNNVQLDSGLVNVEKNSASDAVTSLSTMPTLPFAEH